MRNPRLVRGVTASLRAAGTKAAALFLFACVALVAPAAHASGATNPDFAEYIKTLGDNTAFMVNAFCYVCYMMGIVLSALAIIDLKKHIENPNGTPLKMGLAKLGFGGIFLSLPMATGVVWATMGGGTFSAMSLIKQNLYTFGSFSGTTPGAVSGIIAKGTNNLTVLLNASCFVAYTMGVFFVIRGLQMLHKHVEAANSAPLPESLKRLGVGGVLMALPMVAYIIYTTFGAYGPALNNTGFSVTTTAAGTLDGMMVNFISDIVNPAYFAIEIFCQIAGVLMILFALQRLIKTAQDGPRGPLGFGTLTMFVVAGLLISFPQVLSALDMSLFGTSTAKTTVTFMSSTGMSASATAASKNIFSAVLAFMAVIGFLSIVRGLFMLKMFADGGNTGGLMPIVTHLVAGALAVNLGSFINAVQNSLGITTFPVLFS